jgi:hypothetical protein
MKTVLILLLAASLILLGFAFKASRLPGMLEETFLTMSQTRNATPVTTTSVAPLCPPSFKFYTDRNGRSMCCRGRVDWTEGRCYPANDTSRLAHLCSLGGDMTDEFGMPIQFCGSMIQSLLSELGAQDCTRDKPYRATADGITGFCCAATPSAASPQQCPADSKICTVLPKDKNPFEQSNSCGLERITDGAVCPAGMQRTVLVGNEGEIEGLTVPLCMSTVVPRSKTTPMCIPSSVLNELRRFGKYRNKDLRKWIGNCEIYDRVNIRKTESPDTNRVDLSGF